MTNCTLCPRKCGANREKMPGYCGADATVRVARAAPHFWEEPFLSGKNGSGTVFFTGCQLRCVYCQNREISRGKEGEPRKAVTLRQLADLFLSLQGQKVHNINLVTPDPYLPQIAEALRMAKKEGLTLPVVMNCSGYETVEMLRSMEGLIDVYLPDFKYLSPLLAKKYSSAADYPKVAKAALAEMVRQQPRIRRNRQGMLQAGVVVRHLLLPGQVSDSKRVLAYLHQTYGDSIYISIMSQFTPFGLEAFPELNRCVTEEEYGELIDFAQKLGIRRAFIQEGFAASESFIPAFDGEGVE